MAFGVIGVEAAEDSGGENLVGESWEFAVSADTQRILRISGERKFVEWLPFNQANFCNCTPVNITKCAKRASHKTQETLLRIC